MYCSLAAKHFWIIFILVVGYYVGFMPINFQPSPARNNRGRPCQSLHKPHVLVVCALKQRNKVYLFQLKKTHLLLFSKSDLLEPVWRKSTKTKATHWAIWQKYVKTRSLDF